MEQNCFVPEGEGEKTRSEDGSGNWEQSERNLLVSMLTKQNEG